MSDRPPALFDLVVERSGISRIFARGVVQRACAHAKLEAARLRPQDLPKLLPHLQTVIGVYMPPDEVRRRLLDIAALAPPPRGGGEGGGGEGDPAPGSGRGPGGGGRAPSRRPPEFAPCVA